MVISLKNELYLMTKSYTKIFLTRKLKIIKLNLKEKKYLMTVYLNNFFKKSVEFNNRITIEIQSLIFVVVDPLLTAMIL